MNDSQLVMPRASKEIEIFEDQKNNTLYEVLLTLKKLKKFGKDRILLIDDEEFCISSMRVMLFKLGQDVQNQVDYCMNGQEACELV
jgi:uncharacterized protein YrzB (UPF0473 family)